MGAIHGHNFTEELYKRVPKNTYLRDSQPYSDDKTEREYALYEKRTNSKIVTFRARPLPGCCGVLVVYYLRPVPKKTWIGTYIGGKDPQTQCFLRTLSWVVENAGHAGYGQVILTLVKDNIGIVHDAILGMNRFPAVSEFVNWKTGRTINTYQFRTEDNRPKPKGRKVSFDNE